MPNNFRVGDRVVFVKDWKSVPRHGEITKFHGTAPDGVSLYSMTIDNSGGDFMHVVDSDIELEGEDNS